MENDEVRPGPTDDQTARDQTADDPAAAQSLVAVEEIKQLKARYFRFMDTKRWDEWADLFAEDAVLEWPLAPAWLPRRMNGREEVRRLLTPVQERAIGSIKTRTNSTAAVHLTADPEVLVAELNADIELVTGQRFHNTLVHVIRVREGRIIHFKDYFDPSRAGSDYSASLEAIRQPG